MYDLLLRGGRVVDPARGVDAVGDIAFGAGKVAALDPPPDAEAHAVRDVAGLIVTPGLIDLHTHVYWGATSLGVEAEPLARQSGAITFVDAGSSGPGTFAGLRAYVAEPSALRILAYLNISFPGIYAFSERVMVGESGDLRLLSTEDCLEVARAHRDLIVGIKVRVGRFGGGDSGIAPLDMAIEVADEAGLPVMAHLDFPPPSRLEVLDRLRPGDVLTHCFRPFPNAPVGGRGELREEVTAARERGVIFDIGHGKGSFAFPVARAMLDMGFAPDVISSDVHMLSVDGPAVDLAITMSKFLCLGLPLEEVVRATTAAPAAALGRPELGTLTVGGPGDATVFEIEDGAFDYEDSPGEHMLGDRRIKPRALVIGGRVWHDA